MSQHSETPATPRTAAEVRARNSALDTELRAIAASIHPADLHRDPGNGQWTLAENLGHIAEFPRYFAGDLTLQMRAAGATVGRTQEDADRNDAIAAARGRTLDDLRRELDTSLATLATTLDGLRDEHLTRMANNRRHGPEPLTAFLDRYIVGHKAAHIHQLRQTIATLHGQATD